MRTLMTLLLLALAGCRHTPDPWVEMDGGWYRVPAGTPGAIQGWDEDLGTNIWVVPR